MKFGDIAVNEAEGAILAHGIRLRDRRLPKGRVLSAADIDLLKQCRIATVVVARLEAGDVAEDQAASEFANAVSGEGVAATAAFTGRCNLIAEQAGLLLVDVDGLARVNRVDEGLTIATLPAFALVELKRMLATVKVIPFSVAVESLQRCVAIATAGSPIISVAAFAQIRGALIQTRLPGTNEAVLDKTVRVLRTRLETVGGTLVREQRCDHSAPRLSESLRELAGEELDIVLVVGASAIVDRRDVIPASIETVGGVVEHFGMPVDPGNLLLLGRHGNVPVLGLPGCARSPSFNGFDLVLHRLAAGLPVTRNAVMEMGAGGLLKDFSGRGAPRAETPPQAAEIPMRVPKVAAVVLGAGQSRRMGNQNKLLASVGGLPMIVQVVDAIARSSVDTTVVVTGHEHVRVEEALRNRAVTLVYNPRFAEGLSTSLRRGIGALADDIDAVLVCLGDMPQVSSAHMNRLIAAFDPADGRAICVPTCQGKRGNPVLWARRFFTEILELAGDVGARHLIGEHPQVVCEVEVSDSAVLTDFDSPQSLARLNPQHS